MDKAESTVRDILALAEVGVDGEHPWDLRVANREFYRRLLGQGSIALGETYVDGLWECLYPVVIDSANACDSYADSPFTAVYENVFKEVGQLVTDKPAWMMGHRPIWGITDYYSSGSTGCTVDNQYGCINQMMQAVIKAQAGKAYTQIPGPFLLK